MGQAFDLDRMQRRFAEVDAALRAKNQAAAPATRSEEVLTSKRPFLSETPARVAPMESEHMRNIETAEAEPKNDVKVLYLSPTNARRRLFFTVDRFLAATAPRGSAACAEAVRRADREFAKPAPSGFASVDAGMEEEARNILRARCAICPEQCLRPLI